MENDLISRRAAIDAVESAKTVRTPDGEIYVAKLNAEMNIQILPSIKPWSAIMAMLNELERKQEKLYADYCDATARLQAIDKIAKSSQKPNQKIDGIKPLAEMEVEE